MIGKTISHYKILEKLGEGGMGVVYKAEDTKLQRLVALKFLPENLTRDAEAKARLIQEARAAAALNHPNICTIYEIEESEGQLFLAMEFIEGETLLKKIKQQKANNNQILDWAIQIASGLEAAHEKGVIHRDIKSANVMITTKGQIKIMDFGLARLPDSSLLTDEKSTMGTVAYMSPEQARGRKVDHRTDLWSFGVVLYEMLAGDLPFRGDHPQVVIYSIINETPDPITRLQPDVPPELGEILNKLLAKNPTARYQSASEVLADLRPIAKVHDLGFKTDTPLKTAAPPLYMRLLRYSAIAILLAALAWAVWRFLNSQPQVIDSLAVLPFTNLSPNPNADYLSDGITESLIYSLSQLPNVKVISRNAVFRYKGRETDAQAAGKELGVRAVLVGTMLQREEQLSISVELVDARDRSVIWGENYYRPFADILAVQSDITSEITAKMRLQLSPTEQRQLQKHSTTNSEAYRLYLLGQHYASQYTREGLDKGIGYFNQAIALDSNYALAYFGLAYYYMAMADWYLPVPEAMIKTKAAAVKAIQLDETLVEAHVWLAILHFVYEYDHPAAVREFKRALVLNPNNALAHSKYGWYLVLTGRFDEGLAEAKKAQELDPLATEINDFLGACLYYARRYDEAAAQLRYTIELSPNYWGSRLYLAKVYQQQGRLEEALAEVQRATQIDSVSDIIAMLARAYALVGKRREALQVLEEMQAWPQDRFVAPSEIVKVYLALGDKAQALAWLEKAYATHSFLNTLKVDAEFDPLHEEPRFQDILKKLGLD
ncbi:MAG: protein kinase domain-containing protein [bacterium]